MKVTNQFSQTCVLLALAFLCAGCMTFAPSERTSDELPFADAFALYEPTAHTPDRWWEGFASEELSRLVDAALAGDFTLQQAYARLEQATQVAVQAGALRRPEVNITGDLSVTRRHTDTGQSISTARQVSTNLQQIDQILSTVAGTGSAGTGAAQTAASSTQTSTTESYRFGLASSYELDLWGRVRARHEAALHDLEATREDVHTAMLSVAAQVTSRWLDVVSLKQVLELVREQLASNQTMRELVELRFRKGIATALDVFQQRQIVARTEAVMPPLQARLQTLQHELVVLTGQPPRMALNLTADAFPAVEVWPEVGVPSDLLAARPDVRAVGLRLQSADWRVSAARAERLPALRLTGSASYGAGEWDLVFDNWMATLAGSVTGPLFDAGRRKAEVERTRAVVDERLAAYKQVVVTAMREVEDALVNELHQAAYVKALSKELEAAHASHEEALARYLKGLNDYLPVLNAVTNVQALERNLVQARRNRLAYRVQLHRALGGTWMSNTLDELKEY